ncbi:MAG: DUF3306 domain-containing protein [Rhizobiaceae bacterium]
MNRSDDEGFLTRWSRRKSAAGDEPEAPQSDRPDGTKAPNDKPLPEGHAGGGAGAPESEEPFDLSTLPPIDSIAADTDLSPFFRPGVPSELKLAALRRMWVSDPAIRDFVGLQEYDWDFVTGDIPGFGPIGPDVDVRAMADRLFGGGTQLDQARVSEPPGEAAERTERVSDSSEPGPVEHSAANAKMSEAATASDQQPVLVQRGGNAAAQDSESRDSQQLDDNQNSTASLRARRHGSALPS